MSYAAAGLFSFIPVLVFVTGVIIALVTRRKHPGRSTLAAIGFAVLAVAGILQTGWNVAGFQLRVANKTGPSPCTPRTAAASGCWTCCS